MDDQTRANLEKSAVFVCILPSTPIEGTEGEEVLLYAIALGKKILVFRPLGHELTPLPVALMTGSFQRFPFEYVHGTAEQAAQRVKEMHRVPPGDLGEIFTHEF